MTTRAVIVHDYLTQRGGAERVVLALARAFPFAPILTSLYEPAATFPDFSNHVVIPSLLQQSRFLRADHRRGLPAYAALFSSTDVRADVVICSTSGWAHAVRTPGRKLLYVHNTARWLYQGDEYVDPLPEPIRSVSRLLQPSLRRWDRKHAASADIVLANSRVVQERISRYWGIESRVLHPPHSMDTRSPQEAVDLAPGYFLAVSRLLPYKRISVLLEAMRHLPKERLVVVGAGPERRVLQLDAPRNCFFIETASDSQLRWLYANCQGLVSAANEDLGLAPLEAMAFGRPVAVLRTGGFLETVREFTTGVFFDRPEPLLVAEAIRRLCSETWDSQKIARHADRFAPETFIRKFREIVATLS